MDVFPLNAAVSPFNSRWVSQPVTLELLWVACYEYSVEPLTTPQLPDWVGGSVCFVVSIGSGCWDVKLNGM